MTLPNNRFVEKITKVSQSVINYVSSSINTHNNDVNAHTSFIKKSSTQGLVKNDGTIDVNTYLSSTDLSDLTNRVTNLENELSDLEEDLLA